MEIPIAKARKMLTEILSTTQADKKDIEIMIFMLCEQNYYKNKFSGFSKSELDTVIRHLQNSRVKKSRIVVDKPSVKLIDGQGKSAWLIGVEMVNMVCKIAFKQGIGMVGLYNSTYHNVMAVYSRMIADRNLVGIVMANGGPAAVVPHGGREPIFGTNPISYSFPSTDLPIVFDGATAEYAYGTIRIAREKGELLKDNTYLDASGKFTSDPKKAIAIMPFGKSYKGYAINLMIDILTGILVRAKSGLDVKNESDLGSIFIAIDPAIFMPIDQFKKDISKLIDDIQNVKSMQTDTSVRAPGIQSGKYKRDMITKKIIEIDDRDWREFSDLYERLRTKH